MSVHYGSWRTWVAACVDRMGFVTERVKAYLPLTLNRRAHLAVFLFNRESVDRRRRDIHRERGATRLPEIG